MKRITINDIATRSGVSKGTVSAVINAKDSVKTSTRNKVLAVMKELNFQPKGTARNLKANTKEHTIGLIIRELDNPFYTALAMGVKDYANTKGYMVIISSSEGDHEHEESISQLFSLKDIQGAIIAPVINGATEIEHLFKLKMLNYPFVLLEEVSGIQANVVSIDNIKATKQAVQYLIDTGHSKIIHFSGPPYASHSYERIEGFRRAFSESYYKFNKEMVIPTGSHLLDGYQKGIEYFKNRNKGDFPTAVFCYNDLVALGLISALKELKKEQDVLWKNFLRVETL